MTWEVERRRVFLKSLLSAALTVMFHVQATQQSTGLFNVRDFGAKGDGVTLDTAALNKTIEACAAVGGGTVYLPAGTYLSGTVHLKSNVTLWIDSGAIILGSENLADYDVVTPPYMKIRTDLWFGFLIQGTDLDRVAIIGSGTIDGNRVFNPKGEERMRGPHGVYLLNCCDFTLRDATIKDAGNYATIIVGCRRGNIQGIAAFGAWDAIHRKYTRDYPRDVTIANCRLFSGDDSLAGERWQNVTVTNCILNSSCHPLRLGGQNVVVSNCLIYGPGLYPHRSRDRYNTMSAILHWGVRPTPEGDQREEMLRPRPTDNIVLSGITMRNVRSPLYLGSRADMGQAHP